MNNRIKYTREVNYDYSDIAKRLVKAGVQPSYQSISQGEHITSRTELLGFYTDPQKNLERDNSNY